MKNIIKIAYLFFSISVLAQPNENSKPNILFILVDDLGYSDLSCMGSKYYETPNIDSIANNGMVFTNGYAGAPVCSPSRATIMTGQFTARHGITDWIGAKTGAHWKETKRESKLIPATYKPHIKASVTTLPMALKQGGYTTFFAGKWHLGDHGHYPEDYGFDINIGGGHFGGPPGGFFAPFNNPNLKDNEKGENLSLRLAKETCAFIENAKDKPFFAYLSFYAVHAPIQTTKEKWMKYRNKAEKMGIATTGFEEGDLFPMRMHQDNPVYAGLIETMDDAVGMVLNKLKQTGLDKNTIIIFTSDNGGVTSGDNYSTNCLPLKGGKGYQWEGGIRIPYLITIPWMSLHGQKNDTPVIASDFYPTILEMTGLPLRPQDHIDGTSILPVLKGEKLAERSFYWHYPHYGNQGGRPSSIIRKGDWKLIHYWEDGHDELYNLVKDIHEDTDLATKEPKRTQQMATELLNWLKETGAEYPKKNPEHNEKLEQQAIALKKKQMLKAQGLLRIQMLSKDWQPDPNWWGSIPTID